LETSDSGMLPENLLLKSKTSTNCDALPTVAGMVPVSQ
jgi:hypothetical protein